LKYVETTILGLVKEKVVRYWIDRIMNIGNTTTNTDESSHSQLEKKNIWVIIWVTYVKIGLLIGEIIISNFII